MTTQQQVILWSGVVLYSIVITVLLYFNARLRDRIQGALSACRAVKEVANVVPPGGRVSATLVVYEIRIIEAKLQGRPLPEDYQLLTEHDTLHPDGQEQP